MEDAPRGVEGGAERAPVSCSLPQPGRPAGPWTAAALRTGELT